MGQRGHTKKTYCTKANFQAHYLWMVEIPPGKNGDLGDAKNSGWCTTLWSKDVGKKSLLSSRNQSSEKMPPSLC